MILWRRNMLLR